MWPADFIDWSRRLYPFASRIAAGALTWSNNDPLFQVEVPDLARRARRSAFRLAQRHRAIPGYFASFDEFRFWIMAVVSQQTIRLFLLHRTTRQRIRRLPVIEQRLLRMVYVDHLTDSEASRLLRIPANEVRVRAQQALGRL
jgi:DNA-directed RNA polymerase specialized sigma24 family protein